MRVFVVLFVGLSGLLAGCSSKPALTAAEEAVWENYQNKHLARGLVRPTPKEASQVAAIGDKVVPYIEENLGKVYTVIEKKGDYWLLIPLARHNDTMFVERWLAQNGATLPTVKTMRDNGENTVSVTAFSLGLANAEKAMPSAGVVRGRMLDVNVDVRKSSPTFGQHVAIELVPGEWDQIFVPGHYAHCYCTLEPDTEVIFKLGSGFSPDYTAGLAWNDPALGIDWPVSAAEAIVLERDLDRPSFLEQMALYP